LMARYYVKNRFTKGPHFFFDLGGALLKASNVRSSVASINNAGAVACCTSATPHIANRTARGYVGGLGVQLIDPIGIRVVPEVRYTRWATDMFRDKSTLSLRNQIEAVISLTF
jgi:hypothetical protein